MLVFIEITFFTPKKKNYFFQICSIFSKKKKNHQKKFSKKYTLFPKIPTIFRSICFSKYVVISSIFQKKKKNSKVLNLFQKNQVIFKKFSPFWKKYLIFKIHIPFSKFFSLLVEKYCCNGPFPKNFKIISLMFRKSFKKVSLNYENAHLMPLNYYTCNICPPKLWECTFIPLNYYLWNTL